MSRLFPNMNSSNGTQLHGLTESVQGSSMVADHLIYKARLKFEGIPDLPQATDLTSPWSRT